MSFVGPPANLAGKSLGGKLGGFLGPLGGIAGSLIGGLFGRSGQKEANRKNLQIAREQMAFQERMSNTAYSRAATDLDKAGLNRILALGNPASSPGGALATMGNVGAAGVEGAMKGSGTAKNVQEYKNVKALREQIQAATGKLSAETATALENAKFIRANRIRVEQGVDLKKPLQDVMGEVSSITGRATGMTNKIIDTTANSAKEWAAGSRSLYGKGGKAPKRVPIEYKGKSWGRPYWNQYIQETKGKDISYNQWRRSKNK